MAPVVSSSMYNNLDISSVPFTMTWQRADTCTDGPVMLIQIRAARSNPTVGLRRLREVTRIMDNGVRNLMFMAPVLDINMTINCSIGNGGEYDFQDGKWQN
jgi:hypothetical protein